MKKKYFVNFLSFIFVTCLIISPTFGKYVGSKVGVAGLLSFNTSTFITDAFIVLDGNLVDGAGNKVDQVVDEPKWGTESGLDENFGLNSLKNVEFGVENKSSKDLLVKFNIKFEMNNLSGINAAFKVTLNNTTTLDTLTGDVSFTRGKQLSSGLWGVGATYEYTGTVVPLLLTSPEGKSTQEIVERSFIVYANEMDGLTIGAYSLSIDFSNISSGGGLGGIIGGIGELINNSEYIAVTLVVSPYSPEEN